MAVNNAIENIYYISSSENSCPIAAIDPRDSQELNNSLTISCDSH